MTNQYALAKFTGFTEREVRQLCERYHMSFEQTKDWYDGYTVNGISSAMRTACGIRSFE